VFLPFAWPVSSPLTPCSGSPGNDVTTKPDLYYLTNAQAIDSLALLPPPPAVGSIAFLNDQAMYEQGVCCAIPSAGSWRQRCQPQRGRRGQRLLQRLRFPITEKDAPQLHKLLTNMIEDAGDLATRGAKEKYMRIRPFAFYGVSTCNTTEQDKLSKNGSTRPGIPLSAGPPPWCWRRSTRSGKTKF
jgi:acid phosphatase (class A)